MKSAKPFENEPEINVKAALHTLTAAPETESRTPSPEVESFLPSPTLTTTPETAPPTTSGLGVSDAIPHTTANTMLELEKEELVLSATTDNLPSLVGKSESKSKLTRRQLMKRLSDKPEDLLVCQLTAESYRPCMDSTKAVIEVYGSQAKPSLYCALNKQVAAKAQVSGVNDPNATRRQRIAMLTMYEDITEVHTQALQLNLDKERMKEMRNERLTRTALFHGLGAKTDLKAAKRVGK